MNVLPRPEQFKLFPETGCCNIGIHKKTRNPGNVVPVCTLFLRLICDLFPSNLFSSNYFLSNYISSKSLAASFTDQASLLAHLLPHHTV
jgi:hypothetical protein